MSGSATAATGTANIQSITGNRTIVQFKGVRIGAVQSVRAADNYARETVSGIGDIHAIEFPPTRAEHTISVSNMVLYTGNMRQAGVSLVNGDDALQGIVFDIVTYSRDTGQVLRKYSGCVFDSGEVSIEAHRVLMQTGQFKAQDVTGTGI
jgi:hypothetical protein